jgi:putative drug exporter of the RND superfamily
MVSIREKAEPESDLKDAAPGITGGASGGRPVVERIACWSARHRKAVVLAWLLFIAAAVAVGQLAGGGQSRPQYDPGQAGQGERILHNMGVVTPPSESVLIQARSPGVTFGGDPSMRQAARAVVAALERMPRAAEDISSPFGPGGRALLSADGRSALVTFKVAGPHALADTTVGRDEAAVAAIQAKYPHLLVAEAGGASTDAVGNALMDSDFRKAEMTSVPITLILLLVVFGALIAAGIPVVLAGASVIATISLLAGVGRLLPLGQSTSEVVLILGMAVGVDYSLFYLRREREERAAGKSFAEALRIAAATSGRAIVISGVTVMISLAGLFLTGVDLFTGMAFGTIAVVGVAVVGALTLLPAVLSLLGEWADKCRVPVLGRRRTAASPSRVWAGLVRRVVRHPLRWGFAGVLALLAVASPALGMRIGSPPIDLPNNLPSVQTLDRISAAFPGRPAPAEVVVTGQDLASPAVARAITALEQRASAHGPLQPPITVTPVAGGRALIGEVPLAGDGSDSVSIAALRLLRDQVLPATFGRVHGVSYAVTGATAAASDWSTVLRARTPIVLGVVAALAFIVLLIAFRSLTLPLVSIGLNLLSVGAACGLMVWIFQDGNLQSLLGFTSYGGVSQWVPLFTFVLLFGLSMDYHVFILSRIRERRVAGARTPDAVISGIAGSAGVVTSAAVIMVAVFSIFATMSFIDVKMLGVGLAFAVLIDATVVRGILVPAAMVLLGERCWYLPRRLAWLPAMKAESAAAGKFPTTSTWWPRPAALTAAVATQEASSAATAPLLAAKVPAESALTETVSAETVSAETVSAETVSAETASAEAAPEAAPLRAAEAPATVAATSAAEMPATAAAANMAEAAAASMAEAPATAAAASTAEAPATVAAASTVKAPATAAAARPAEDPAEAAPRRAVAALNAKAAQSAAKAAQGAKAARDAAKAQRAAKAATAGPRRPKSPRVTPAPEAAD